VIAMQRIDASRKWVHRQNAAEGGFHTQLGVRGQEDRRLGPTQPDAIAPGIADLGHPQPVLDRERPTIEHRAER